MNLSFPDSLERLNLSGNAIARIAGVTFPASLAQLSIDALAPAADDSVAAPAALSQKSALKEFEVRQTDAALFAKLEIASFDVAATTTRVTCSDTRAKPVYVRDTMLCVLPDDVFAAKYGDASTSNGGATNGGGGGSDRTPREKVDESFGQSRSWFLLVSALALGGFVACLFGVALCRVCGRRLGVRGATADTASKAQHAHQQRELLVRDQDGRRNGADDDGDDDEPDTRAVV
ncbi:hypothetical protein PybrP1_000218 [[Pythium] brassicae (nom. inval.)]|nr:hypothetical protein PybrP1_000218 [[Pythium] brassicae (nom. inval.)]